MPTPGISTTLELGSDAAAIFAQANDVMASKLPDRMSVGILLRGGSSIEAGAAGTSHARQSSNTNVNWGGSRAPTSGTAAAPASRREDLPFGRERVPLATDDPVGQAVADEPRRCHGDGARGGDAARLAVGELVDPGGHVAQQWRDQAQRDEPVRERRAVEEHRCASAALGLPHRRPYRVGLEAVHEPGEGVLQPGMIPPAAALGGARVEQRVEGVPRVRPEPGGLDGLRRHHQVEDDAADAVGVVAHERKREVRPVGDPEDVPPPVAERAPQVRDVGGVLRRVIGREVDALGDETRPAARVAATCRRRVASAVERRFSARRLNSSMTGQARKGSE